MGPDAEDGPGPQWAAPKQLQPVFHMKGFVTKDERGHRCGGWGFLPRERGRCRRGKEAPEKGWGEGVVAEGMGWGSFIRADYCEVRKVSY